LLVEKDGNWAVWSAGRARFAAMYLIRWILSCFRLSRRCYR